MKKVLSAIMILSTVGIIISTYLVIKYYNPTFALDIFSCGTGCEDLIKSGYSGFYGIPLATFGLIFYIFIFTTLLVALFAEGRYPLYALAIITPIALISVIADFALFGIIIYTSNYCLLCITTYIINIIICYFCYKAFKIIQIEESMTIRAIYKETFKIKNISSDRTAASLLYFMFIFLLISFTFMASTKNKSSRNIHKKNSGFVSNFFRKPIEKIDLPEPYMTLGNPDAPVEIIAFTDFFCSACKNFYNAEKFLIKKYKDKVHIKYYNFPLRGACVLREERQKGDQKSCISAKAMLAASKLNRLKEYLGNHYNEYNKSLDEYDLKKAIDLFPDKKLLPKFKELINSNKLEEMITRDLKIAEKLDIKRVPTLFINKRKIVGVPYINYFDEIVKKEIENAGK